MADNNPSNKPTDQTSPQQPSASISTRTAPKANKRGGGSKPANAKTLQKYNRMWEAYQERQSANHLVKSCGVHWTTATRAIREGWPRFGLPPLRERWATLAEKSIEIADFNAAKARAEALQQTRNLDDTLHRMIQSFRGQLLDWRGDELRKLKGSQVIKMMEQLYNLIEKSQKLKLQALGDMGSERGPEVVQQTVILNQIRTMSDEELDRLIEGGGLEEMIEQMRAGNVVETTAEPAGDEDEGVPEGTGSGTVDNGETGSSDSG